MGQGQGIGAVGEGGGGIVVSFEKEPIDAGGDSRAGQRFDEFGLAAAGMAQAAGNLDGVSDVVDDGVAELLEDREGAHVDDEVVVAERGSALSEDNVGIAGGGDFFGNVAHIPWGEELGLLDIDDASGFRGGEEKIGLAREEGGDLENVRDFGGGSGLGGFVDVGEDREVEIGFDFGEDAKALGEAGAAERFDRGSIGLVIRGFEDIRNASIGGNFRDVFRHHARVGFGFNDAWPCNKEERIFTAEA